MKTQTAIADELLLLYTETDYIVQHATPFTLNIGESSPPLLQLFEKTNTICATFITAYNPFSELPPEYKNKELQAQLEADLIKRSLNFVNGLGHPYH